MKRSVYLLASVLFVAVSCSKSDDKKTNKSSSKGFDLPTIDFALPEAAYTLNLAGGRDASQVLSDTQTKVNDRIDKLNADMEKWNTEFDFSKTGEYTGKGPNGTMSYAISEISEGEYTRKMIFCESGNLHMVVKWSSDNKNVYSWRNQLYRPEAEDQRVLMTYVEDADGKKTFTQKFFGAKDKGPAGDTTMTDDYLADHFSATQSAAGAFTFSSVEDWFTGPTRTAGTADGYLAGNLDEAGTGGNFVAFRAGAPNCTTFDEASPATSWCKAATITGGVASNADKATTWATLTGLGLALTAEAGLADPTVSGETCPAAN